MTLNAGLPTFYKDKILHWQGINNVIPKTKKDVLDQITWKNRFIKINNGSMFYQNWHQAGVNKLSSVVDGNKNRLLTFKEFLQKFSIKCNWLQYCGLTSTILSEWKKYLKDENQASTINLPVIDKITCKTIQRLLIDNQYFSPPTAEEKLTEYGFSKDQRQNIHSLPFLVTKEIKLSFSVQNYS